MLLNVCNRKKNIETFPELAYSPVSLHHEDRRSHDACADDDEPSQGVGRSLVPPEAVGPAVEARVTTEFAHAAKCSGKNVAYKLLGGWEHSF